MSSPKKRRTSDAKLQYGSSEWMETVKASLAEKIKNAKSPESAEIMTHLSLIRSSTIIESWDIEQSLLGLEEQSTITDFVRLLKFVVEDNQVSAAHAQAAWKIGIAYRTKHNL